MRLWLKKAAIVLAALCIPSVGALLFAQTTGPQLPNPVVIGKLITQPAGPPPTYTTCTGAAGSTDMAGTCTATAAAAVITFGTAYTAAPFCVVVDASATPVMVYTVSTTAITISATTNAHVIRWHCVAQSGG